MKSRTRSRSVATSGLGVKSIAPPRRLCSRQRYLIGSAFPVGAAPAAWAPCSGAAVAGEELAVLLEQPGELELGGGWQFALEDRRPGARQLRRHGQEQLVDQPLRPELGVQPRPALA